MRNAGWGGALVGSRCGHPAQCLAQSAPRQFGASQCTRVTAARLCGVGYRRSVPDLSWHFCGVRGDGGNRTIRTVASSTRAVGPGKHDCSRLSKCLHRNSVEKIPSSDVWNRNRYVGHVIGRPSVSNVDTLAVAYADADNCRQYTVVAL